MLRQVFSSSVIVAYGSAYYLGITLIAMRCWESGALGRGRTQQLAGAHAAVRLCSDLEGSQLPTV